MGVTSPLQPRENTSNGRDVSQYDPVADPEDQVDPKDPDNKEHPFGDDIKAFTRFMRSTKAPPRDFAALGTDDVREGEKLFRNNDGPRLRHLPPPRPHDAGRRDADPAAPRRQPRSPGATWPSCPPALGNKVIHPYSDFLLHDVGTGDGIAQTQHAQKPPRGIENLAEGPRRRHGPRGDLRVRARPTPGTGGPSAPTSRASTRGPST